MKKEEVRDRRRALRIIKRAVGECYECRRPAIKGGRCKRHYLMAMRAQARRRLSAYSDGKLIKLLRRIARSGEQGKLAEGLNIFCSCGERVRLAAGSASYYLRRISEHIHKHGACSVQLVFDFHSHEKRERNL